MDDTDKRWDRLLDAAPNRDVSEREQARWVSQFIGTDPSRIPIGSAPNRAAITMLRWANGATTEFYRNVYSKLLPSKAEMERADGIGASDNEIESLIDRIEAALSEGHDEQR